MAGDEQLIENLRSRTWPGDCEAAAFRIEELLARVAELEGRQCQTCDGRGETLRAAIDTAMQSTEAGD